jgi:hypothetical protein
MPHVPSIIDLCVCTPRACSAQQNLKMVQEYRSVRASCATGCLSMSHNTECVPAQCTPCQHVQTHWHFANSFLSRRKRVGCMVRFYLPRTADSFELLLAFDHAMSLATEDEKVGDMRYAHISTYEMGSRMFVVVWMCRFVLLCFVWNRCIALHLRKEPCLECSMPCCGLHRISHILVVLD